MKEFVWKGYENFDLVCYLFDNVQKPKGVVQIVHGMQEHALRYQDFAAYLNNKGFIVFVSDLRGHGKSVVEGKFGFDNGNIFTNIVQDQKIFSERLKSTYPKLPLILLGHSYGSFVAQRLLLENTSIDKFVISGSAYMKTFIVRMANLIANIGKVFKGKNADALLVEKLSIRSYGKNFDNGNWLSRDESVFEKYKADPLCGRIFPNWFYCSMFSELPKNYRDLSKVSKETPILLIGGEKDPVSSSSKMLCKLYEVYEKAGLKVKLKIYKDSRHEVLNEVNKQEVYEDVLQFITK